MVTCDCRKHAPDPGCDRPEHSADRAVSSPAAYEERIRLLLAERRQAIDALRQIVPLPTRDVSIVTAPEIARAALVKLGEQP